MPGYTEDEAREAVAASLSYSEALRRLGLRPAGGNAALLRGWLERWGISTGHFDPYAGRLGRPRRRIPLEDVLVEHSTYSRGKLKHRLYDAGLKTPECELCGQGEVWRGRRMAMILDHVNGVADDNRLENLRIVCPNCAATFDTHCARKNRRPRTVRECLRCRAEFVQRRPNHRYCSRACGSRWERRGRRNNKLRRVERPPYEQLVAEISASSFAAVGRKYGVSDNAIRKWVRQYERERGLAGRAA